MILSDADKNRRVRLDFDNGVTHHIELPPNSVPAVMAFPKPFIVCTGVRMTVETVWATYNNGLSVVVWSAVRKPGA